MSRFDYVKYDDKAVITQDKAKELFHKLEVLIGNIGQSGDGPITGRSKSLAMTKLEESYMWVGKLIRDDQIARNGSAPLQEERKDG